MLQISQENIWDGILFVKKDSDTGVICEICKIFKNTYFEEYLRPTASDIILFITTFALFR